MTASPDDAAASSTPPRAAGRPAAPSYLGTTGRRTPEDSPMPQHRALPDDTVHDETVRMRADGADGRPSPDGVRPAPAEEFDDTRPVTRDWLLGAPDPTSPDAATATDAEAGRPARADDHSTQALDLADPAPSVAATDTAVDTTRPEADVDDAGHATEPVDTQGTSTPPPPGDEPPAGGSRGRGWRHRSILVPAGV